MGRGTWTLALGVALAGCFAQQAPGATSDEGAPLSFADEAGDAKERGLAGLATAGGPAPYFDLTAVRLAASPSALVFELVLAGVQDGFPELDARIHRVATYDVCFSSEGESRDRCAVAEVAPVDDGVEVAGSFWLRSSACNEWSLCVFAADASLVAGTPAVVRIAVPMAVLDGAPGRIGALEASVSWRNVNAAAPRWHTALSVDTPPFKYHRHEGGKDEGVEVADTAGPFTTAFGFAPEARGPPADRLTASLGPGAVWGHGSAYDRPELDLLSVDLRVEGSDIVARWTVASLTALPEHDFLYFLDFGVGGKEVWEMGFIKERSGAYGYAGHCISYECAGDHGGDREAHGMGAHFSRAAASRVEPGAPGLVEVRTPISTFPSIRAGDQVTLVTAETLYSEAGVWVGRYGDAPRADWHEMSTVDARWGGMPFTFRIGNTGTHDVHPDDRPWEVLPLGPLV